MSAIFSALRFFWWATAGYRLRPWLSPYLRWRVETYTGISAGSLTLRDFVRLAFVERRQMLRFFRWLGELRELSGSQAA
jgi:hypothetical protein